MAAIAYYILTLALLRRHGRDSELGRALGNDFKGKISVVIYLAGIVMTCFVEWLSLALYVGVAAMWLVPDRRIERELGAEKM
jgi:uncharacterized membrane protein